MAYGKDGDFNFLEVGRAAFDLSDRGVTGRTQPGPVDAYLYTDRGIYRPGETVHLVGLVRDDAAEAIASLPVTARLLRPDGVEVDRRQITGDRLGAYELTYPLARDARIGSWRVEFRLDPKAPPIGIGRIPRRGFRAAAAQSGAVRRRRADRAGRGFPDRRRGELLLRRARRGSGGRGRGDDCVRRGRRSRANQVSSSAWPARSSPERAGCRGAGDRRRRQIDRLADLTDLPDLTKPLAATVRVSVVEPSGRAVTETADAADPAASAGDRVALPERR